MDIKQILRDAIDSKVAEILKEEYGIEPSKKFADKLLKDDQDYGNYQIRLTSVGDHKIRVVKVVFNNMGVDLKTAKSLVDQAPSVISPCLTFERATEIVKLLNNAGATAHVEKIECVDDPLDWTPIPSDEQGKDPNYQVTLLDSGEDCKGVIDFIASKVQADPTYANALVDHAPSVIITGLCKEAAVDISNELAKLGAGSSVESVIPTGTTSKHVYQLVLTNRSSGVHREDVANIVEQIEGSKSYANFVLTSNAPLVIARGLNYFAAVELKKSIVDKGGDVAIEEITKID